MNFAQLMYAVFAGFLPSLVWLSFWLREDIDHPEPRTLIAGTFLAGCLSVLVAVFAEKGVSILTTDDTIRYTAWAAIEETVKLLTVVIVALNSKWNDEPIDAMIYIITVALGFSALENAIFIMAPISNGAIAQSIVTGGMRFIGASLVHVVSSAIIGFAIGFSFYRGKVMKFFTALLGLIGAIALHAGFNISIVNSASGDTLKSFTWIWAAVVIILILFEEIKSIHVAKLNRNDTVAT